MQSATAWANVDAFYRQYEANSFASAAASLVLSNGSPWAAYDANFYAGQAAHVTAITNAAKSNAIAQATSQRVAELAQSDSETAWRNLNVVSSGALNSTTALARLGFATAQSAIYTTIAGSSLPLPTVSQAADLVKDYQVSNAHNNYRISIVASGDGGQSLWTRRNSFLTGFSSNVWYGHYNEGRYGISVRFGNEYGMLDSGNPDNRYIIADLGYDSSSIHFNGGSFYSFRETPQKQFSDSFWKIDASTANDPWLALEFQARYDSADDHALVSPVELAEGYFTRSPQTDAQVSTGMKSSNEEILYYLKDFGTQATEHLTLVKSSNLAPLAKRVSFSLTTVSPELVDHQIVYELDSSPSAKLLDQSLASKSFSYVPTPGQSSAEVALRIITKKGGSTGSATQTSGGSTATPSSSQISGPSQVLAQIGDSSQNGGNKGDNDSNEAADGLESDKPFNIELFKQFLGQLDRIALSVFEKGDGRIERRSSLIFSETAVTSQGGVRSRNLTIWIDKSWDELDAAIRVIEYMENSWSQVHQAYQFEYLTIEEAQKKRGPEAFAEFKKQWYKNAAEVTSTGVAIYLGMLSIVNEGADLVVTVEELSKGNWMASIGLLPFVPAGGFVRVVDKAGNSKLLNNTVMQRIRALGNDVDVHVVQRILDAVPDDIWCFGRGTLVSTPAGKRPIESIQAGERVCAFDYQQNAWVASEVTKLHRNRYTGLWCSIQTTGGRLEVTAAHPIWVQSGQDLESRVLPKHFESESSSGCKLKGRWVNSHHIMPGDKLVSHDGKQVEVLSIELSRAEDVEVFNLTVYNTHTFAVGDDAILAHNKSWCDALGDKIGGKPGELLALIGKGKTDRGKLITGSLIHGHHIVMKTIPYDVRGVFVKRAQDILAKYDVKLLGKIEELEKATADEVHNLCYAVNGYKGIHSLKYTQAVTKELEDAVRAATRRGKVSYDDARENIIKALAGMKAKMHKGEKFW